MGQFPNTNGRPKGVTGPERLRKRTKDLYDVLLKKALAGDAEAIRLCFEITGEHPKDLVQAADAVS